MCECYKIGGRFIAEDPECPVHGYVAQQEAEIGERERQNSEELIAEMGKQIRSLQEEVASLRRLVERVLN
jgi:hypothetical protein